MVSGEHIDGYIKSLIPELPAELEKIEEDANFRGVPIIRKDMQQLMRFLIGMHKPAKVLEIGTAVGFSSLFMAECISKNAALSPSSFEIITIEKDERMYAEAVLNISASRHADNIKAFKADAAEFLENSEKLKENAGFDMIFIDAAKAQYRRYIEIILERGLIRKNGLIITDNILQEGSIAESKFTIVRRDRTIHKRLRDYVKFLMTDPKFETVLVPTGDGAALTNYLGKEN